MASQPHIKPQTEFEATLRRLTAALDHLEAACERRVARDAAQMDMTEELAVMQDDRARLAVELDGALAQSRTLAHVNSEIARRLAKVSDVVRAVLVAGQKES